MRRALLIVLAIAACLPPAAGLLRAAATTQHSGEILGMDREGRTLTVQETRREGKEILVFRLDARTMIRDRETGRELSPSDLHAGDKVTIKARQDQDGRVALEVLVRSSRREKP